MRILLAAASLVLLSASYALGATDFSGTWVLDLRASNSSDPMLKRLGVSWIERKLADSIELESIYTQTTTLLTIHTRGPAFGRTELIRIDGEPETKEERLTGPYTIRTEWIDREMKLLSTISFHTKDRRDAQLTVLRELADGGKTLLLTQTLKVSDELVPWIVLRVWRKRA
ncbi:MAG TPA: hypothetical protein VHY59_07045 [Chthoniobacterales bacterium]|nr:hypothetical protein [Chthoniobacterales bacterium]